MPNLIWLVDAIHWTFQNCLLAQYILMWMWNLVSHQWYSVHKKWPFSPLPFFTEGGYYSFFKHVGYKPTESRWTKFKYMLRLNWWQNRSNPPPKEAGLWVPTIRKDNIMYHKIISEKYCHWFLNNKLKITIKLDLPVKPITKILELTNKTTVKYDTLIDSLYVNVVTT